MGRGDERAGAERRRRRKKDHPQTDGRGRGISGLRLGGQLDPPGELHPRSGELRIQSPHLGEKEEILSVSSRGPQGLSGSLQPGTTPSNPCCQISQLSL